MKLYFRAAVIACLFASMASAQSSSWRETIEGLARANAHAPVAVPRVAGKPEMGAAQTRARDGILFMLAAERARELSNPDRSKTLLVEAKAALIQARQQLSATEAPGTRSQVSFSLGRLTEKYGLDLDSAAAFYAEAVALNPSNQQASEALARVRAFQEFRRKLKG